MIKKLIALIFAGVLGLAYVGSAFAFFHTWRINEIYSNADGSVQFVKIEIDFDMHPQNQLVGRTLVASNGSTERSFTFDRFIDCPLCTYGDVSSFIVGNRFRM